MMRGHFNFLKTIPGTKKFARVLIRMSIKPHSKVGSFLRIKNNHEEEEILKRLYAVRL